MPLQPRRASSRLVSRPGLAVLLVVSFISGAGVLVDGVLSGRGPHVVFGAAVVALAVASCVELLRGDQ
jgi:hypothetical protein